MEAVPEDWQRALTIVAHPDDLEYGASAAIAKWTAAGKTVIELLATRGEAGIDSRDPLETAEIRTREQIAAAQAVGVSTVEFLDHPDGLLEYGLPLRRDLALAIRRHRPDVVISLNFRETWAGGEGFNMADHRVLGLAVADAVRDAANRWVFRDLPSPAWKGVKFALFANSPNATHYVDVTGHLDAAIASLQAHKAYLEGLADGPGQPFDAAGFLTEIASAGGRAASVPSAILFELINL